jgi:hypothetical protein
MRLIKLKVAVLFDGVKNMRGMIMPIYKIVNKEWMPEPITAG